MFDCKYWGDYWGEKDQGFCICAIVAQMRGAKFELYEPDATCPNQYYFTSNSTNQIAWDAVYDIADWLGIHRRDFLDVLSKEREKILERAPKD